MPDEMSTPPAAIECDHCKQAMGGTSCTMTEVEPGWPAVPVDDAWCRDGLCHDCGAPVGGFHHPGCDAERCPRCGGQLISCGCFGDADDDIDDVPPTGGRG